MKKVAGVLIFSFVFILQACSWQEYFVITNQTEENINIEYEIISPSGGFPIFEDHPSGYKLNASNEIDWTKTIEPLDLDTARLSVKIILEPKQALIIGYLSNDHYKKHDQYFINGRSFNLKKLQIQKDKTTLTISPENFDEYFFKKNGTIVLRVKK